MDRSVLGTTPRSSLGESLVNSSSESVVEMQIRTISIQNVF